MADYKANPNNLRAFRLATSLNNLMDWHWHALHPGVTNKNNPSWDAMRRNMEASCSSLRMVKDLCDASKHCGLNRGGVELQDIFMMAGRGGAGGYDCPTGGYDVGGLAYGGEPEPLIRSRAGVTTWASDMFDEAFEYWERIIAARKRVAE